MYYIVIHSKKLKNKEKYNKLVLWGFIAISLYDLLFIIFFMGKLFLLHTWLVFHNLTFYENIKKKFKKVPGLNPFDKYLFYTLKKIVFKLPSESFFFPQLKQFLFEQKKKEEKLKQIQQRMKNQKSEGEEEEEEESEDIRYRKKIKDDATERKDINNTKNDNIKDEYENKSTTSKIKSEFSFEKDKVEVMKPIKLKDKKAKGQNKSFTNKNLINFISPDISEVGTGNQDVATIENKDKKLNKTNLVKEDSNLNNGNKKKKSLKISDNHQNNFVKNNLETLEALTPKRNIKSNINFEDDDMEGEFVISNKITFKSNGSDKNLKQSINDK